MTSATKRHSPLWLMLPFAVMAAVLALVMLGLENRSAASYATDTEETLVFNGNVWSNPTIADGVATFGTKVGPIRGNPPYPPYYDVEDNETSVLVDGKQCVNPRGNNVVFEVPVTAVTCDMLDRGNVHLKTSGRSR